MTIHHKNTKDKKMWQPHILDDSCTTRTIEKIKIEHAKLSIILLLVVMTKDWNSLQLKQFSHGMDKAYGRTEVFRFQIFSELIQYLVNVKAL